MEFKDYYATLGLDRGASQDDIKQAYRKLARKYHPDVSKEAGAEGRFKEVAEAYEALHDPQRRAAYDEAGRQHAAGQDFRRAGRGANGFSFSGHGFDDSMANSDFFESLFGGRAQRPRPPFAQAGEDQHAKVSIDLEDAYLGARRHLSLRVPVAGPQGQVSMQERELDVAIPAGVREGQQLRLAGQGSPGVRGGPAGDLYLEISFKPNAQFRAEGRDIYLDLRLAPWEAALGAEVSAPTPDGSVRLSVPPGSTSGRKLRLKGKGLPSSPPGDLYVVLTIALPPADTEEARRAYLTLADSFASFNPRENTGA